MIPPLDPGRSVQNIDYGPVADSELNELNLGSILAVLRRQSKVIMGSVALSLLIGSGYLMTATPKYTAVTQLLIDSKKNGGGLSGADSSLADLNIDTGAVDSQVEIIKSTKIASSVVEQLGSLDKPVDNKIKAIAGPIANLQTFISSLWSTPTVGLTEAERQARKRQIEIADLAKNLAIRRVGRTYVLEIAYTDPNAFRAAEVSGAFARAYLDDQFDANYEITRRASDWLLSRISELKEKSLASDLAVQKFRAAKGLITAKDGVLVNDQQLTEMNTQLMTSRGDVAEAQAKYDRIQTIIQTHATDAAVSEAISSPIIIDLRNKYLAASKLQADIARRLGPNHEQAIKQRAEMKEYERLIFDELGRIAESYKSALHIAQAREAALEQSVKKQEGVSGLANEELVSLRELERESDTYKNLYQSLLQRYQETIQKQSFPVSEARIISQATAPLSPSSPQKALVMALAGVLGLVVGGGMATLREFRDRGFRTSKQVRDQLGMEFLGMLPLVNQRQLDKAAVSQKIQSPIAARSLGLFDPIMRYSIAAPLSNFTEALRGVKVALDITLGDKPTKIVAIASVLPNEGKSTVAKNFASLTAHLGQRTLLIDADLRNPGLTRALSPQADKGLLEVLMAEEDPREVVLKEHDSGLVFLPAVVKERVTHTGELLASRSMKRLLDDLSPQFDFIVIDLPPLGPVIDAKAAAKFFDAFVFVVEWGATARDVVASTLASEPQITEKCTGVILNKVDMAMIGRYQDPGAKEYYYHRYGSYYGRKTPTAPKALEMKPPQMQ